MTGPTSDIRGRLRVGYVQRSTPARHPPDGKYGAQSACLQETVEVQGHLELIDK